VEQSSLLSAHPVGDQKLADNGRLKNDWSKGRPLQVVVAGANLCETLPNAMQIILLPGCDAFPCIKPGIPEIRIIDRIPVQLTPLRGTER
jgi:hypothetical protein